MIPDNEQSPGGRLMLAQAELAKAKTAFVQTVSWILGLAGVVGGCFVALVIKHLS